MLKRFAPVFLCLVLIFSLVPSVNAFSDIHKHKAKHGIEHLKERGIIKGKDKDKFSPDAEITNAEAITMLTKAFNLSLAHIKFAKAPVLSEFYPNLKNNAWYSEAYLNAHFNGVGLDQKVKPNDSVTREQFAVWIVDQFNRIGNYSVIERYIDIKDEDKISNENKGKIQTFLLTGMTSLDDKSRFHPQKKLTRGEAAMWLSNAIPFAEQIAKYEEEHPSIIVEPTFKERIITSEVKEITISADVPHPGYGIEVNSIYFEGDKAIIEVIPIYPDPDLVYPQVITTSTVKTFISTSYKVELVTSQ